MRKGEEGRRGGLAGLLSSKLLWPVNMVNLGEGLVMGKGDEREVRPLSLSPSSHDLKVFFFFY